MSIYPNTRIKGFDIVLSNLNKAIQKIEGGTLKGLLLAAALIRRETERTPPLTPVDTGNLRASWFVVSSKGKAGWKDTSIDIHGEKIAMGKFKGPNRAEMAAEHSSVTQEAKAMVDAQMGQIIVLMGYSANYAMHVHEMTERHFKRDQAGPKWFETAVKRNANTILSIIENTAKLP